MIILSRVFIENDDEYAACYAIYQAMVERSKRALPGRDERETFSKLTSAMRLYYGAHTMRLRERYPSPV